MPAVAAALRWNPLLHLMGAEFVGMALLGRIDDPATSRWARAQLRRTTLATVVSATEAVCEFTSDSWISQVDVPTAVVITDRDRVVPPGRQAALARAVPGASVHYVDAGHGACVNAPQLFAPALLKACGRWRLAAAAHCAHQPDPAGPRCGRHPNRHPRPPMTPTELAHDLPQRSRELQGCRGRRRTEQRLR